MICFLLFRYEMQQTLHLTLQVPVSMEIDCSLLFRHEMQQTLPLPLQVPVSMEIDSMMNHSH